MLVNFFIFALIAASCSSDETSPDAKAIGNDMKQNIDSATQVDSKSPQKDQSVPDTGMLTDMKKGTASCQEIRACTNPCAKKCAPSNFSCIGNCADNCTVAGCSSAQKVWEAFFNCLKLNCSASCGNDLLSDDCNLCLDQSCKPETQSCAATQC